MTQVAERVNVTAGRARPLNWLIFNAGFALIAAVGLVAPAPALGWRVLLLTLGYSVGIVILAVRTADPVLTSFWCALAPMSVLMVLPDWFLSAELGTLVFPDTGAPFIGTMPVFMAFMWVIALLPVMLLGWVVEQARGLATALVVVVIAGLVLFTLSEYAAPLIPLWHPQGVTEVVGVAPYVLLPEAGLTIATYLLVRGAAHRSRWATAAAVVAIPFMYLGMLCTSLQFTG